MSSEYFFINHKLVKIVNKEKIIKKLLFEKWQYFIILLASSKPKLELQSNL